MATVAKQKTVWFCTSCGNDYPKWMGRCPACGEWNTIVEQKVVTGSAKKSTAGRFSPTDRKPRKISGNRSTGDDTVFEQREVDRLLGWNERLARTDRRRAGYRKIHFFLQIPLH